ncbi:hypothetical protein Ae717Ps2_4193 [Pseudonocardia sp. Ae717_Ps2]|nr:hypothetical protein Ae717Ps2_4193 [Pseudonocardia sp. Ae717_Ps2]
MPTTIAAPTRVPTTVGTPQRSAWPGRDALSGVGPTGSASAIVSHWNAVGHPATATPTSVATAAAAIPARNGRRRACTAGSSSTGASEGLRATVTP